MDNKILETLEYDQIRDQVAPFLNTFKGLQELDKMKPLSDIDKIQRSLNEVQDVVDVYQFNNEIPMSKIPNMGEILKRLNIGATLSGLELSYVKKVILTTHKIVDFLNEIESKIVPKNLVRIISELELMPSVLQRLSRSIEGNGHLKDEASDALMNVRYKIKNIETNIRSSMEMYTTGSLGKYLSENIITIRNNRYVIPVKKEEKQRFGGIIHDQSDTGQTLYIEPDKIVNLNNDLRQCQLLELDEEQRVLRELSALIGTYSTDLDRNIDILGYLDLLSAKAKHAIYIKGSQPILSSDNLIYLRQARHPLLDINKVVPNDILLGDEYRSIVITGPNTGGKTIMIKTLGLIQLMAQSGLFIPALENSSVGVFESIYADIGDEQSIEQNLSTFSSHMSNIISILKNINQNTLVLLDELGSGTDPQEGSALAISIIKHILNKKSMSMITTHYPELKVFSYDEPGVTNASMEFDVEHLKPTYRFMIGLPGQSNAFKIANILGMDEHILEQAQQLVDEDSRKLNNLISNLLERRERFDKSLTKLKLLIDTSEKLVKTTQSELNALNNQKSNLLSKARLESNAIVSDSQNKADLIIKKLRKLSNQTGHFKENDLIQSKSDLNNLYRSNQVNLNVNEGPTAFKSGDFVMVMPYNQRGTLVKKLDKNHWEVQMGSMNLKVSKKYLVKTGDKLSKPQNDKSNKKPRRAIKRSNPLVSTTLDLRGVRYEEAMYQLDQYFDKALLSHYDQVTIIHGKGTGAIRSGVTNFLEGNNQVVRFEYAPDKGSTTVYFS